MIRSENYLPPSLPKEFALTNGKIALQDQLVVGKSLLIRDQRVLGIANRDEYSDLMPEFDVRSSIISPGFIDLHVHGANGHTFNETTEDAFRSIIKTHLIHGTTSLLATIATAPINQMIDSLEALHSFRQKPILDVIDNTVIGVHIEGPFFSEKFAGAQDINNLRVPNARNTRQFLEHSKNIKIFSLAPELPGALELIRSLSKLGVIVAAGHSDARDSDVAAAMNEGLSHIIHIWNAQSMTIRQGVWRKPGMVEASLTFDGLSVEMIADNKHLPPTLMQLAYKAIGPDRLCLVSDATAGAGLDNEERFIMGETTYKVKDGVGMTLDETSFAGSTSFLSQMIRVVTQILGIPLVNAIRMSTATPAKVLGINDRKGSLRPGMDADIVLFQEENINIMSTIINGALAVQP